MTQPPRPPGGQIARWLYHFTDARSGVLRATLPMRGASFEQILSDVGQGSGAIPLTSRASRAQEAVLATVPRRSCLWAERQTFDRSRRLLGSTIEWGGIIMSRTRSRSSRELQIKAMSWEGYLAKRLVRDRFYRGVNKSLVLRALVLEAMEPGWAYDPGHPDSVWGASQHTRPMWNEGSQPVDPLSVLVDRTYLEQDRKTALEAVKQLAATGTGLDWRMVPYRDPANGMFRVRLEIGYPRLGRTQPPGIVWSSRENESRAGYLADYTLVEDGSSTYNRVVGLGSGQPPAQLTSVARNTAEAEFGYPLYETVLGSSTDELVTQAAIDSHTQGALLAGAAAETQITGVTVRGDLFPTLDTYQVADDATLRIDDLLTGQRLDAVAQIAGRKITPPEQGRSETVVLDLRGTVATPA